MPLDESPIRLSDENTTIADQEQTPLSIPNEGIYRTLKETEWQCFSLPENRPNYLLETLIKTGSHSGGDNCGISNHNLDIPYAKFISLSEAAKSLTPLIYDWGPQNQWCSQCILGVPYLRFLYLLSKKMKFHSMLEIGTSHGGSAINLSGGNNGGHLVCVDIEFKRMDLLQEIPNVTTIKGNSLEVSSDVAKYAPFDFVFFDSEHNYEQLTREVALYRLYLSSGAIALFDDIALNDGMRKAWNDLQGDKIILSTLNTYGFGAKVF